MCWGKSKTKSENKNTTNEYRYFLESNFFGVSRLFVLVYSNKDANSLKDLKLEDITSQKELLRIITASSMKRTFTNNPLILL